MDKQLKNITPLATSKGWTEAHKCDNTFPAHIHCQYAANISFLFLSAVVVFCCFSVCYYWMLHCSIGRHKTLTGLPLRLWRCPWRAEGRSWRWPDHVAALPRLLSTESVAVWCRRSSRTPLHTWCGSRMDRVPGTLPAEQSPASWTPRWMIKAHSWTCPIHSHSRRVKRNKTGMPVIAVSPVPLKLQPFGTIQICLLLLLLFLTFGRYIPEGV